MNKALQQFKFINLKNKPHLKLNPPLVFLAVFLIVALVRTAWMSDDSYITLRTVDNFVHGYGLTWNVNERVQAYTHPLWMFLIIIFYFFTHEAFYTTVFISIAISLATFVLIVSMTPRHSLTTYAGVSILFFSKAFVDFSTSGLENPVTHLLLAFYLYLLLKDDTTIDSKTVFQLSLIAGLATLNRMDVILFLIPSLLLLVYKSRSWKTIKPILLGFLPFIAWEIFSVIYYGFPFPNTAYAKLDTGIRLNDALEMGYLYFINSIHWDPITLFTISITVILAMYQGNVYEKSVVVGVIAYLLYIMWIGGDFMSGRFFTAPLLVSVVLFNRQFKDISVSSSVLVFAFIIILGFISPTPTLTSIDDASLSTGRVDAISQISDERSAYYQPSSLIHDQRNMIQPYYEWVFRGIDMKNGYGRKVYESKNIGFAGYFAGPEVHIIDKLALADPLLAHLPPIDARDAKPGHYERLVPDGYPDSIRRNENRITDPSLAEYYEKIRIITQGPIWNWERFVVIWKMNTGQYNYLVKAYSSKTP